MKVGDKVEVMKPSVLKARHDLGEVVSEGTFRLVKIRQNNGFTFWFPDDPELLAEEASGVDLRVDRIPTVIQSY